MIGDRHKEFCTDAFSVDDLCLGDRFKEIKDKLKSVGGRIKTQGDQIKAQGDRIKAQGDQIKAQGDRIIGDEIKSLKGWFEVRSSGF